MERDTKYKILYWAVIFLALLNISTIATIFINSKQNALEEDSIIIDPESSPLSGRYIKSELGLDQSQLEFYRNESRQFRHYANEEINNLNFYKNKLSQEMHKETPNRNLTRIYSDSIGIAHANLKEITTDFYLKLRQNCTPSQAQKLEKIFDPLFKENLNMHGNGKNRESRRNRQSNQRN